jgi:hypothetical protein
MDIKFKSSEFNVCFLLYIYVCFLINVRNVRLCEYIVNKNQNELDLRVLKVKNFSIFIKCIY